MLRRVFVAAFIVVAASVGADAQIKTTDLADLGNNGSSVGAQSQFDPSSWVGLPSLGNFSSSSSETGTAAHSTDPFATLKFLSPSSRTAIPLSGTPSQNSHLSGSTALGYASSPSIGSFAHGPTSLPAESGINYMLSPFAGYLKPGSGLGSQAVGGGSMSVAFPIGHSFGLLTDFTAASIGGSGLYTGGTNLYWRDPGLGLVGGDVHGGHFAGFGGANFASGGANFEGYYGRFTPFATVGAFGVSSLATRGYGTLGTAYYPTDNLQLDLGIYDYGGRSGVQGGVECLLPKQITAVATTVSVSGFVGNHGTSGAMARLKFLLGPTPANNKTLIERRRQDDPRADAQERSWMAAWGALASRPASPPPPTCCPRGDATCFGHPTCP